MEAIPFFVFRGRTERLLVEPTIQDGEPVYLVHGKVDFFGDEAMTRTGGAGKPACTVLPTAEILVKMAA
jgi:hypothetical protein